MTNFFKRNLLYLAICLLCFAGLLFYIFQHDYLLYQTLFHLEQLMARGEQVREAILAHGGWAPLMFIGLQVLQVLFALIPSEASGALGGYLFGAGAGFVYSTIGVTVGSLIAFAIGRLFNNLVASRLHHTNKVYKQFNHLVQRGNFAIPFLLFLIPGIPKDIVSYMLGMSIMPLPVFFFVMTIGRMPGTFLLSLQGAEVYQGDFVRLVLLMMLTLLLVAPCYIYRQKILVRLERYNNRNQKNDE